MWGLTHRHLRVTLNPPLASEHLLKFGDKDRRCCNRDLVAVESGERRVLVGLDVFQIERDILFETWHCHG